MRAALRGAGEIGFTVISLTVSLIAVFIPLLFMTGLVGRMFREFALTLTIAVVASAVISLTLTPMMCGRLLRASDGEAGEGNALTRRFHDRLIERTVDCYHQQPACWVLRHQRATLIVTLVTLAATIGLYVIDAEGLPAAAGHRPDHRGDRSRLRRVLRRDAAPAAPGRGRDPRRPDVTGVVSVLGVSPLNATPNAGHLSITLRPRDERSDRVDDIIARLKDAVAGIPGMTVYFQAVQDIQISTRVSRAQYQYTLVVTDARRGAEWADKLTQTLRQSPRCATSPPRRRRAARASWCRSTASRPAASASPCRA